MDWSKLADMQSMGCDCHNSQSWSRGDSKRDFRSRVITPGAINSCYEESDLKTRMGTLFY